MAEVGLFDVIGPRMVGPSSSHTAGACRIAVTACRLFREKILRAEFTLYGSFAETGSGHGTREALAGGALGFDPWDLRIRKSMTLAEEAGMEVIFRAESGEDLPHPNTVDIRFTGETGRIMEVRGISTGGGKMKIVRLDGVEVAFTGDYPTLIIFHRDVPGVIRDYAGILGERGINIADMRCFRKDRFCREAISVVESDHVIYEKTVQDLERCENILRVILLQVGEGRT